MARENAVGSWAFILGVVIAVIAGIVSAALGATIVSMVWVAFVLVILGLIIGFTNIASKDSGAFLLAIIALAIIAYVGRAAEISNVVYIGAYIVQILEAIMALIIPAAIVVALKDVWAIAYEKAKK